VLVPAAAVLFYAAEDLPTVGDVGSAPSTHVSPRYIEDGPEETGAPNMVTGVLADYRGYDTFGELTVIFTAGLACLVILSTSRGTGRGPRRGARRRRERSS
jgi:multicomponent Na+:H+ antiporter subunit B